MCCVVWSALTPPPYIIFCVVCLCVCVRPLYDETMSYYFGPNKILLRFVCRAAFAYVCARRRMLNFYLFSQRPEKFLWRADYVDLALGRFVSAAIGTYDNRRILGTEDAFFLLEGPIVLIGAKKLFKYLSSFCSSGKAVIIVKFLNLKFLLSLRLFHGTLCLFADTAQVS